MLCVLDWRECISWRAKKCYKLVAVSGQCLGPRHRGKN
jgi:hypothetical protein